MSHPCCISLPSAKYFYDTYLRMVNFNKQQHCVTVFINFIVTLLLLLVGGGAKEEQQRLNLSGTLCRPSIRPITIFHRFFFFFFYSD